jgi:hypothetical protein
MAVLVVAGGAWRLARAEPARPATTPWGGNAASVAPGEIVIRPTGRKVRVVSLAAAPAARRGSPGVRVVPAAAVTTAAAFPPAQASLDDGLEYGPQSVRLPLAYDPRDNFGYGCGPITYAPACGPSYGGYGGYGGAYGYADAGYGYGYGRAYGGGYRYGGFGRHGFARYSPAFSSFCGN